MNRIKVEYPLRLGLIAYDNIVSINRRYFPELIVAFHLSEPESLVWYFNDAAHDLWKLACEWFPLYEERGELARAHELHYGYVDTYDYVDTRRFIERINTRLPKYRPLFEAAAGEYAMRWTIPASICYQESHWRPNAKSPTGVRGMMMLTQATAREMGVTNRLDPEQSVRGGIKYLSGIFSRLPETIQLPDRYWITLAAYNVGYYHVMDARVLARRLGKDQDVWADLSQVLPLLAERKYYKTLRYGYARGYEPVRYVTRIRDYEDILVREIDTAGP